MALDRIPLSIRPSPTNMTIIYLIQKIFIILTTTAIQTKNCILYNHPKHEKLKSQHTYITEMAPTPKVRIHNTDKFHTKISDTMINARNPQSLPNITLYKLFFPDPPKSSPTAITNKPGPSEKKQRLQPNHTIT